MTREEPTIIINGHRLTRAQSMTVRVALSSFEADCGNDAHGIAMTKGYNGCVGEIIGMLLKEPVAPVDRFWGHSDARLD